MSQLGRPIAARPRLLVVILLSAILASVNIVDRVMSSGPAAPPATVGLAHSLNAPPISDTEVAQMVRKAVDLAEGEGVGLTNVVHPGQTVLIQPNLVNAGPDIVSGSGVVTDVRVVKEVVAMCFEAGASSVKIGEGTAAYLSGEDGVRDQTWRAFYFAGYSTSVYSRVFKYDSRVELVNFNDAGGRCPDWSPTLSYTYDSAYVTGVTVPNSLLRTKLYLPNVLMQADVVIKVPVLKNHNLAGVTGSLKTAVGTAPCDIYHYPGMYIYKWALLHQPSNLGGHTEVEANAMTVVDLNKCRKPDFVVTDGLVGLMDGPVGTSKPNPQPRSILAGRDPVAVDTVECLLEGYDPAQIPSLVHAADAGLGTRDPENITVKTDESQSFQHVRDIRVNFPDGYGAGRRADQTNPQMDGLTAAEGSVVSGPVTIAPINPRDTYNNLCKVELFVDGEYVGKSVVDPYAVTWNSQSVADGPHQVKMYLYDNCLNETGLVRNITVRNSSPVAAVLGSPDNTLVQIGNLLTSVTGSGTTGWLYAQAPDRSGGVKVLVHSGSFPEGSLVEIGGRLTTTPDGERCIDSTEVTAIAAAGAPRPLALNNRSLGGGDYGTWTKGIDGAKGLYNVGLLVRTWGRVTYVDTGTPPNYFYLDDGSNLEDGSGHLGVKVLLGGLTAPALDQRVTVTGISAMQQIGGLNQRVLIPRKPSDIN